MSGCELLPDDDLPPPSRSGLDLKATWSMTMSSKRWMSLAKGSTMGLSEVRMSCSIEIGVHSDVDSSVEVAVDGCWSLLFAFVWVPEVSKERALRPLLARCWAGDLEGERLDPWGR